MQARTDKPLAAQATQPHSARQQPTEAEAQFTDRRSESRAQELLRAQALGSPRVSGLQALQAKADASIDVAKAEQLATLQRQAEDEEEVLQGKFQPIQRMGEEDEEEVLQGKFAPVQRASEEEEPLQGHFAPIQRQEDDEEEVQLKAAGPAGEIHQLQAEGPPARNETGLPDNLKAGIESLSGLSMDAVRVHYNSSQPAQLNALAYAQGTDIHVAPGQEQHLPHEAWHVVQQAQGRVKPTVQAKGTPINDDRGLEEEADVMGGRAAATGRPAEMKNNRTLPLIPAQAESVLQGEFWTYSEGEWWPEHEDTPNPRPTHEGVEGEIFDDELDDEDDYENDSSVRFKETSGNKTYRSSMAFYDTKEYSTRDQLVKLQTGQDGNLRSGFGGTGTVIKIDKKGREVRKHKTPGAKNKRPDIDHRMDFLILDEAADHIEEPMKEPMSPNSHYEFKTFLYNDPENLEIKAKSEHTSKRTFRRDSIPEKKLKEAKNGVKKRRTEFLKMRTPIKGSMGDLQNKKALRAAVREYYKERCDRLMKDFRKDDKDKGGGNGGITA